MDESGRVAEWGSIGWLIQAAWGGCLKQPINIRVLK
jgi:hypothetical protein